MEVKKGLIVRANAGRDKGEFFVIVDVLGDKFVLISNGKQRPIEKPKRKKIKHICVTKTVLSENRIETNRKIRRELSNYNGNITE